MFDKMKQLMEMKRHADQIKRNLDAMTVDSEAVCGIKISLTGSQQFRAVTIDESYLKPEKKEQLQRELLVGINAAIKESQNAAAQSMKEAMPDLGGF